MALTEAPGGPSELVREAAAGRLPEWAVAGEARRAHMERVASLLGGWAEALALPESERLLWRALGYLHDVLRDAPPEALRDQVPEQYRDLPGPLLHGPAAAERLAGALPAPALDAIRFHTLGHPALDRLGRAVYLADFLEPERDFLVQWRAALRARMPHEMDGVLVEVLAARIGHLLAARRPLRPETAEFWAVVVGPRG